MNDNINFSAVSETLFIPLYCRAIETESKDPIVKDMKAVEIMEKLDKVFRESENRLFKALAGRKLSKKLSVTMGLRTRKFDEYVRNFIKGSEKAVVVNMGCGLDTRFDRVDNRKVIWYDIDFPDVIEFRKNFISENERRHFIGASVLDYSWIEKVFQKGDCSYLFIAEGLFMYLYEKDVRELVMKLQSSFPGSEIVCEVANRYWVNKMKGSYFKWKFQRQLYLSKDAVFNFGISDSRELEKWNEGIEFLDEWTYYDDNERKLGWFKLFKGIELLKKVQWIIHYKLN